MCTYRVGGRCGVVPGSQGSRALLRVTASNTILLSLQLLFRKLTLGIFYSNIDLDRI